MNSKDIIILVIGTIFSILATLYWESFKSLTQIGIIYSLIALSFFSILLIAYILHSKIKETEEKQDKY